MLFSFPLEYLVNLVNLKQYPDWLIGLSSRLKVTVTEILSVAALRPESDYTLKNEIKD